MQNARRILVDSVRRYARAHGLGLATHSHDWISSLDTPRGPHHVFGYDLGLNGSAAHSIANDKSATYEVLAAAGIAALEHRVFLHPRFFRFLPRGGNWRDLRQAFEDFGLDAVVKDNEGTGGLDVFRVRSEADLETRVHELLLIARAVALSPYVAIEAETRFVMLGGDCLLAYRKERPGVSGDGRTPLGTLIAAARAEGRLSAELAVEADDAARVPAAGEQIPLLWRHNLGQGAVAVPVEASGAGLDLARRAMSALGLTFAAIDVIAVAGSLLVLEANSGVMIEALSRTRKDGDALADRIYHTALDRVLEARFEPERRRAP